MAQGDDQNKNINYEQFRLKDAVSSNPELADTYLERVNTFQAHVEEVYEKIEVFKAAKNNKWQDLENSCEELQSEVLDYLISLKEEDLDKEKENFDKLIDQFLDELSSDANLESEEVIPKSAYEIFESWQLTFDTEQIKKLGRAAIDNYGEDEIRKIDARMKMIETLPIALKEQIFPIDLALDYAAIFGQLANCTLQDGTNAFLLNEPEHLLRKMNQDLEDQVQEINDDLEALNKKFEKAITLWAKKTEDKKNRAESQNSHEEVLKFEKEIEGKRRALIERKINQRSLNASLSLFNATRLINSGNSELGNRMLLNLREKFGNLEDLHPQIEDSYQQALYKLNAEGRLSNFEANLHFDLDTFAISRGDKSAKIERAFETSVKAYKEKGTKDDLLDQIRNSKGPTTFNISKYKPPQAREVAKTKTVKLIKMQNSGIKPLSSVISIKPVKSDHRMNTVDVYKIGWQPEFDQPLTNITTQNGKKFEGITFSQSAKSFMENVPRGMKVALARKPSSIKLSEESYLETTDLSNANYTESRIVENYDTINAEDLIYVKADDNNLSIINVNDDVTHIDVKVSEESAQHQTQDLLRAINCDFSFGYITRVAAQVTSPLQNLEKLFSAGTKGKKYNDFIKYTRTNALEVLGILDHSSASLIDEAKEHLTLLKDLDFGQAHNPLEAEIANKIKVIESMIGVLENKNLRQTLESIIDKSTWHEDDFWNWLKYDGAKILLTVAITVAIIVSVVATCGGSLPILAMAGLTAGTAVITGELVAEGMYQIIQATDEDVKSGRANYKNRSLLGKYLAGEKIIDPETKELVEMDFLKDVIGEYSKQFLAGFITAFAGFGLGKLCSQFWSSTLQNSRITIGLKANYPKMSQVLSKLNKLQNVGNLTGEAKTIAKKYAGGVLDSLADELKTMGASEMLTSIDERLAGLAAFVVIIQKEFHPLGNVNLDSKDVGTFSYSKNAPVEKWAKVEGYQVLSKNDKGEFEIGILNYVFKLVPEAA